VTAPRKHAHKHCKTVSDLSFDSQKGLSLPLNYRLHTQNYRGRRKSAPAAPYGATRRHSAAGALRPGPARLLATGACAPYPLQAGLSRRRPVRSRGSGLGTVAGAAKSIQKAPEAPPNPAGRRCAAGHAARRAEGAPGGVPCSIVKLSGPEGPEPALVSLVSTDGGVLSSRRWRRRSTVAHLHVVVSICCRCGLSLPECGEMCH